MQPPRSARPTIGVGEDDLVTGDAVALRVPAAGPGLRVASGAIDVVCGALLLFGLSLAFGGVLGDLDDAAGAALVLTTVVTTLVILPAAVETLTRGRSLGRLVTGTCIVRDDGGPVAFVRDGDRIRLDVSEGTLDLLVDADELASRREGWEPLPPRYTRGVLAKYSKLVRSASEGAVCR